MFHITCCGASISKDQDMIAIGDFGGNLKVMEPKTGLTMFETNIQESIRYLHFHDFHNNVLLIGTFSGNVFVWNLSYTGVS